ncbi:peptidoglycan-binding protein LysM [Mariniphaga sp.]|uniref:peptidoglycan-binding protein LysM n=1 Tax=Mariniphaga sp. TaxID=1954475 RepID=UPI003564DC35
MGLISFIKGAGSKLFKKSEAEKEPDKGAVILNHIKSFGFQTENLQAIVKDETVILTGKVETVANKNRIVVAAGNVEGISEVEDMMSVMESKTEKQAKPQEPEKQFYTVVSGDSLSKIALRVYGNANKYPVIFDANTPMLKHPDKIYPGQVLVIPPLD